MIELSSPNGGYLNIDMWYGDAFEPMKYGADAYFSESDYVYRGNIYNDQGKVIGDYESDDSSFIGKNFLIDWEGSSDRDSYDKINDTITGATDISDEQVKFFYNGKFLGACDPENMHCDKLLDLMQSNKEVASEVLEYMNSLGDPVFPKEGTDYEAETEVDNVDIDELYSVFMQELWYDYEDTKGMGYDFYVGGSYLLPGFEIFDGQVSEGVDLSSSTKYGADMCSIGASDEQESEDDYKYYVAGYLGDNYRGLMSDLYSDDFEEILSTAADMSAQGLFVKITNRVDGRSKRYTPEDFEIAAEYGEYPDHIREDLAL